MSKSESFDNLPLAKDEVTLDGGGLLDLGVDVAGGDGGQTVLAEGADEVGLGGGLGLDVVGEVVGVVAQEVVAAGGGGLGGGRVHELDAVHVVGVDDGGDVEVGQVVPAVEGDLAEHAGGVLGAVRDGVPVADPGLGEVDGGGALGGDLDRVDGGEAGVGDEVDGAVGVVEGLEGDGVGGDGDGRAEEGEKAGELHLEGCVLVFVDVRISAEGWAWKVLVFESEL